MSRKVTRKATSNDVYKDLESESKEKIDYIWKKSLGEISSQTAADLVSKSYLAGEVGDHEAALEYAEKAYRMTVQECGHWGVETLPVLGVMSVCYYNVKDYKMSERYAKRARNLCDKLKGMEHPDTFFYFAWETNVGLFDFLADADPKQVEELCDYYMKLHKGNR
ncbi:MAG: tetratricopeptide repeat protein [Lachnospiraceae bacterium]|nr:tetratricopeptide repeat protein [Lachnospiraceae bacterium]